jgi:hypothetical protein
MYHGKNIAKMVVNNMMLQQGCVKGHCAEKWNRSESQVQCWTKWNNGNIVF